MQHDSTIRRTNRRTMRSTILGVIGVIALVVPLVMVPALPAQASHYIASEPRVDIVSIDDKWQAEVTISSVWDGPDPFSLTLLNPDGNSTDISAVRTLDTGTTTNKTDVYLFDLTSLTTADPIAATGMYIVRWNACCKISFYNTGEDRMGFEAGFWFDPSQPDPADSGNFGSPRFTASLITDIAGGSEFNQSLGGVSPNGNSLQYSLNEDRTTAPYGAPVTKSGSTTYTGKSWWTYTGAAKYEDGDTDSRLVFLSASGQLTIPSAVTAAIAAHTDPALAVGLRLEEYSGSDLRGYVTRDIGFTFETTDNVAPAISGFSNGDEFTVSAGAGTPTTIDITADDLKKDSTRSDDSVTLAINNLPSWATASTQSGTNPATRTITIQVPTGTPAGTFPIEVTAADDNSVPLTTSRSFTIRVSSAPAPAPAPAPAAPAPSPVVEPGGGLPVTPPGVSTGSVGGVPVVPTPARPTPGAASFQVGSVQTSIDVAVAGAGTVDGAGDAPVLRATRDRVATISGGGMRPGGVAEVWMPLPDGGSRQVALLPIGADGTFDGALPFTGELDGRGPLPIGDRTIQLFGTGADGQLTVINVGVRVEQPGPLAPEPERSPGAPPTLAPGQSLATVAGVPTAVTVTPVPDARSTRIEGDGWLMDVDVPDGTVRDEAGAPLIEIVNGSDSRVRGTGFLPGTRAYVWLMSDPTFLGEVTVSSDGSFSGDVPIDGVAAGEHTLQLSGVGTDGFVRAANLGVVLLGDGMPRPTRIDAGEGPAGAPFGVPVGAPFGVLIALGGLTLGVAVTRQRAGLAR